MAGFGYIYLSNKDSKDGLIWSCQGDFSGRAVGFKFSDCEDALRARLTTTSVTGVSKNKCSNIPSKGIRVTFRGGPAGNALDVTPA